MRLYPLVVVIVLVGSLARLGTLIATRPYRVLGAPEPVPSTQLAEIGEDSDGTLVVRYQWLDPEAAWIVDCGGDGAPGRADVDDNQDGVIDDPFEMGATGSDDICRAVTSTQLLQLVDQGVPHRVLQHGAFVETTREHSAKIDGAARAIVARVNGSDANEHFDSVSWSQVIDRP